MYNPAEEINVVMEQESHGPQPAEQGGVQAPAAPSENSKRSVFDRRYLKMAYTWACNSYAIRRRVGALIVKNGMIISDGYNGTPSGFPNICEYIQYSDFSSGEFGDRESLLRAKAAIDSGMVQAKLCTMPHVLHAEANAITKLARHGGIGSDGATLYTTTQPCMECSKLIIQAGISRVVFCEPYHDTEGLSLLRQAGIEITQVSTETL